LVVAAVLHSADGVVVALSGVFTSTRQAGPEQGASPHPVVPAATSAHTIIDDTNFIVPLSH
jgi:hypothetical protein